MFVERFKIALKLIIKTLFALATAALVACWAVPCAYAQRGYMDIGGEALLILATFVFTLWLCYNFRKILKKVRKERKEGCLNVTTAVD